MLKRRYFNVFVTIVGLSTVLLLFVVHRQTKEHRSPVGLLYSGGTKAVFNTLGNPKRSKYNLMNVNATSSNLTVPYEGKARTLVNLTYVNLTVVEEWNVTHHSAIISEPSIKTVEQVSRSSVTASTNSFLTFMEIDEQLSSNTAKFLQLSYFSALWNLSMIEPWIEADTNFLYSLPPTDQNQTLLFFDLYNMTGVENRITRCFNDNVPPQRRKKIHFHTLSEALIHSPRDVLIVRFMRNKWSKTKEIGECSAISVKEIEKVTQALNSNVLRVKDNAQEIHGPNFLFKIWRTLCITAIPRVPFSMHNATVFIERQLAEKRKKTNVGAMVVLPSWNKIKSEHPYGYYYDPNFHFSGKKCSFTRLPHSHLVLTGAKRMQKELQFSQHFIGVYARTERISHLDDGLIDDCLSKFRKVLEDAEKMYGIPRSRVVVVHDAGKYGSNTFDKNERNKSDGILVKLQSMKIQTKYYDPKLHKDLPQHRAFVAAVEQEFLSQSHVLITLGGGGFQLNVMNYFKTKQSVDRVHALCI